MVCRWCILPSEARRLTHFSGALSVFADSLIFHPSPKGLPTFLVCLREIFPMEVSVPSPTCFNKNLGGCLAVIPPILHLPGPPLFRSESSREPNPIHKALGQRLTGSSCWWGLFACNQGAATGEDAKEFQVTDSPLRVCGLHRPSWSLWWLCIVNGPPGWPGAEAWGAPSN